MSPFKKSPSAGNILSELKGEASNRISSTLYLPSRTSTSEGCLASQCPNCSGISQLSWPFVFSSYYEVLAPQIVHNSRPSLHALLLTDCSNVLAGIAQGNPRTKENTARLICSHLGDLQLFLIIGFCCAPLNLSDVGAKTNSNVAILRKFLRTGLFSIGFLSRSECKAALRSSSSSAKRLRPPESKK